MNTKKYTAIILAGIMVCAVFAAAMPAMVSAAVSGEEPTKGTPETYTGTAGTDVAKGGNITQVNFTGVTAQTTKWQGYYGNISGGIALRDSAGTHTMYTWTWSNTSDVGYALATPNTTTPNWSALGGAAGADINTAWSFTTGDKDSATNTFTDIGSTAIVVGDKSHAINTAAKVLTYNYNASADKWETVALKEGTAADDFVFVGIGNTTAAATAFNDEPCDYQMIVPVSGGSTQTYYFYVELH